MDKYPDNIPSTFTNYIDPPIILPPGEWTVGITEIFVNKIIPSYTLNGIQLSEISSPYWSVHDFIYVHCDIIAARIVGDQKVKCLKVLPCLTMREQSIRFGQVEYIPVEANHVRNISIKMSSEDGEDTMFYPSFLPTMISLHFKKTI